MKPYRSLYADLFEPLCSLLEGFEPLAEGETYQLLALSRCSGVECAGGDCRHSAVVDKMVHKTEIIAFPDTGEVRKYVIGTLWHSDL